MELIIILLILMLVFSLFLEIKYNASLSVMAILIIIATMLNLIVFFIDIESKTSCEEVWSGRISSVKHVEEWDEYHPEWVEEVKYTDSKGKTKTKIIKHEAWVEHHNAYNTITTTDDGTKNVYKTLSGIPFSDEFVNSDDELKSYYPIGMPTASVHIYENKVQASYSIYKHQEINLDEYQNIPQYPLKVNNYNIERIVGETIPNKEECIRTLNECNSYLNDTNNIKNIDGIKSYKQINMIYVNLGNVTEDYGYALQDFWQGGNKNDFIIVFGSKDNKITWCQPFSWSDSELVKIQVKDYMLANNDLNYLNENIINISKLLEEGYERKQFADFNYLQIEIGTIAKVFIVIISLGFIIIMMILKDRTIDF